MAKENCSDCGVKPGRQHKRGCDVALCPECGFQRLQCGAHARTAGWGTWTGEWPGEVECREWGWYRSDTLPDGTVIQAEDLNRLVYAAARGEIRWDKKAERYRKA